MLAPGIYEQLINQHLRRELQDLPDRCQARSPVDPAEAAQVLSQYLAQVLRQGLENVVDNGGGLDEQINLINQMVATIGQSARESAFAELSVDQRAELLLAVLRQQDPRLPGSQSAAQLPRPETSLARSSLFTGAAREPQLYSELAREIQTADQVVMLVSFIRWSGQRLLWPALQSFCQTEDHRLRVITTSYLGATELKAIEALSQLPNTEIRISYDTRQTRLHAKTYLFERRTGFTTAYIGSSNLSAAALSSGLEWNVKVTAQDLPDTIAKIRATFDSYWHAAEFEPYQSRDHARLQQALRAEQQNGMNPETPYYFDLRPYPYQQEILDQLQAEREVRGCYRNLVVAATGTGKTVISAFDYQRYVRKHPGQANRLLFVAHREEILRQSLATFRAVLRDANFGELYVGSVRPDNAAQLFISIQMLQAQTLWDKLPADYYDFIIVDEFHHAAAPSYRQLLNYFTPHILLGLTATPERLDGQDILATFDGRMAAEIRLPEAIDRGLLCPFQYFGVTDPVDLSQLRWVRGSYDREQLSQLYSLDRAVARRRAEHILNTVLRYCAAPTELCALGFCVSVAHARFMADFFTERGLNALALTAQSPSEERQQARGRLRQRELNFIFVVDLYNEGVDIPEVNTVLFLRPTESLTVFLQQLGRGLRLSEGKDCLTVLDFIGQANRHYDFESKFAALLAPGSHSVAAELKQGFPSLPRGCYIQLEKVASRYVLNHIRQALNTRAGLISRLVSFSEDSGQPLSLAAFLAYYHLDPRQLYARGSLARLSVAASLRPDFQEAAETAVTRALPRLASLDSRRWIRFLQTLLPRLEAWGGQPDPAKLSPGEQRLLSMFYLTLWPEAAAGREEAGVEATRWAQLAHSPVMLREIRELLAYNISRIDFIDEPVNLGFDCPLDLHCSYSRDQLLAALDHPRPATVREGVKWLPWHQTDVLLITLNKSDKDYSPSTMYRDYSINEQLFHWQSQSTTAETSPTGQRYIHHRERGSQVLLFVRASKQDPLLLALPLAYTYLGKAEYVEHRGSRPMTIIWRLERPIPAKFLKVTNQLLAV